MTPAGEPKRCVLDYRGRGLVLVCFERLLLNPAARATALCSGVDCTGTVTRFEFSSPLLVKFQYILLFVAGGSAAGAADVCKVWLVFLGWRLGGDGERRCCRRRRDRGVLGALEAAAAREKSTAGAWRLTTVCHHSPSRPPLGRRLQRIFALCTAPRSRRANTRVANRGSAEAAETAECTCVFLQP